MVHRVLRALVAPFHRRKTHVENEAQSPTRVVPPVAREETVNSPSLPGSSLLVSASAGASDLIKGTDVVVAIMGTTGVGKSTFIAKATEQEDVGVGHGLNSETSEVKSYRFTSGPYSFVLVDTPGFNDSSLSNQEIAKKVLEWLESSYSNGTRLSGIIYMHSINNTRMQGSSYQNMKMFRQLCGDDALQNVVLATSFWDLIDPTLGEKREKELVKSAQFWANMVAKGSDVVRLQPDRSICLGVLEKIAKNSKVDLLIQKEMVSGSVGIVDTTIGKSIMGDVYQAEQELKREREQEKERLKKEMEQKEAERKREMSQLREAEEKREKQDAMKRRRIEEEHQREMQRLERERSEMRQRNQRTQEANRRAAHEAEQAFLHDQRIQQQIAQQNAQRQWEAEQRWREEQNAQREREAERRWREEQDALRQMEAERQWREEQDALRQMEAERQWHEERNVLREMEAERRWREEQNALREMEAGRRWREGQYMEDVRRRQYPSYPPQPYLEYGYGAQNLGWRGYP